METAAIDRIDVLHRSARLAVLAKPAGLALLADRTGAPCLWDGLPALLGAKPYLVHRLDKGTSGVLLVALDQRAQSELTRAFSQRIVRKFYLAWVVGSLSDSAQGTAADLCAAGRGSYAGRSRTIDLPLKPGRKSRYRVAGQRADIRENARGWTLSRPESEGHPSLTRVRVLADGARRSLLLLEPRTGRTHQLRVHLSWIGHPILGDALYGRPGTDLQAAARLQLHCHRLVIPGWGSFTAQPGADWLDAPA